MDETRTAIFELLGRYRGVKVCSHNQSKTNDLFIAFRCRWKKSLARLASVSEAGGEITVLPNVTFTKVIYRLSVPCDCADDIAGILALGLVEQPELNVNLDPKT